MIVLLKKDPREDELQNLVGWFRGMGLDVHVSRGSGHTLLGLIGDTSRIDIDLIQALELVESVTRIQEPYKNANRKFHPRTTACSTWAAASASAAAASSSSPGRARWRRRSRSASSRRR